MMKKALLAGTATLVLAGPVLAEDWRDSRDEISFGVIPVETQTETTDTMDEFAAYAEDKLGVPVEIFTASDYVGVNNALVAEQIDMAWTSPSAYSGSWLDCDGCLKPLVTATDKDGNLGYNAVLIVQADSPYQSYEDLEGKTVARTDPNSQSGYLVPTVQFHQMDKPIDEYFNSPVSGGHTQSVLGVLDGTYDAAFTWTTEGDGYGQLRTMMDKGMLDREDIRVIWTSDLVPPPPVVAHQNMPADMEEDVKNLFLALHEENMELAESVAKGETQGFVEVDHSVYEPTIEMRKTMRELRTSN
ncbi:MAG: phosphate/phosphite/phosphonate ABC transporter substrate-binding protein [Pseudomonadota bacterium]